MKAIGLVVFVLLRGTMDYTFLGESKFLIEMGIVAVGVVVLGIKIRKQKPASKNKIIGGKR